MAVRALRAGRCGEERLQQVHVRATAAHQRVAAEDLSGVPPAAVERDVVHMHQRMDDLGEAELARGAVKSVGQQVADAAACAGIGLQDHGLSGCVALQPVRQAEQETDQAPPSLAREQHEARIDHRQHGLVELAGTLPWRSA